jgi:hypothetical protein
MDYSFLLAINPPDEVENEKIVLNLKGNRQSGLTLLSIILIFLPPRHETRDIPKRGEDYEKIQEMGGHGAPLFLSNSIIC